VPGHCMHVPALAARIEISTTRASRNQHPRPSLLFPVGPEGFPFGACTHPLNPECVSIHPSDCRAEPWEAAVILLLAHRSLELLQPASVDKHGRLVHRNARILKERPRSEDRLKADQLLNVGNGDHSRRNQSRHLPGSWLGGPPYPSVLGN
jgi:hypothetical protein